MARTLHLYRHGDVHQEQGNPCPGSMLLEEVPETPLDFWEATEAADAPARSGESNATLATLFPLGSIERKLAILAILNQHAQGQVRVWGGQWQKKAAELTIPLWAADGKPDQLANLERCTRPYGAVGDFPQFVRFTKAELEDQVNPGMRPSMDTIQKLFWAPGPEGSSQTTW